MLHVILVVACKLSLGWILSSFLMLSFVFLADLTYLGCFIFFNVFIFLLLQLPAEETWTGICVAMAVNPHLTPGVYLLEAEGERLAHPESSCHTPSNSSKHL